jgi:hypothetical protein
MVVTKGYGQLRFKNEAIEAFKKCREPDETRTDTLMKLIKTYQETKNRKCPDLTDRGIIQT